MSIETQLHDLATMPVDQLQELDAETQRIMAHEQLRALRNEIGRAAVVSDMDKTIAAVSAMTRNDMLLSGPPGTGKTLLAKILARSIGGTFGRFQGTPDLLPSDITGSEIFSPATREFEFREGPIFRNVVIGDEMSRATTKTQSGLYEPLAERTVTVGGKTYNLDNTHVVILTQNPNDIEQGTNPLTNGLKDRVTTELLLPRLTRSQRAEARRKPRANQVVRSIGMLGFVSAAVDTVSEQQGAIDHLDNVLEDLERHPKVDKDLSLFDSMRPYEDVITIAKGIALTKGATAEMTKSDINDAALYVLGHRTHMTYEARDKHFTSRHAIAEVTARAA